MHEGWAKIETFEVGVDYENNRPVRRTLIGGRWPEWCAFSYSLLAEAEPSCLSRDGDRIMINLDDARAVYQIVEDQLDTGRYLCQLIEGVYSWRQMTGWAKR